MSVSDPYQWQESVLSTRSLSYISTADALESTPRAPVRSNTLTSMSSLGEEQEKQQESGTEITDDLPASVAQSPLFNLPHDIRLMVWKCLLTHDTDIHWPSETRSFSLSPQLLRVCRPIYQEAARVLYTTNTVSFAHPSDANMFVHAMASPVFATMIPHATLRIKAPDTRLWTAWFNTNSPERSLIRDFPSLQQLTIRYTGPRWQVALNEKANADLWLKDPKLQEVILSVRKCVGTVRLLLCVRLPSELRHELMVQLEHSEERFPHVMFRKWVWMNGCFIRVEPIRNAEGERD